MHLLQEGPCLFIAYPPLHVFTVCFETAQVSLSDLLRVHGADACTQPLYALQQVVVLPVHRCAPASQSLYQLAICRLLPAAEGRCCSAPVSWPALERRQLPASPCSRQAMFPRLWSCHDRPVFCQMIALFCGFRLWVFSPTHKAPVKAICSQ